CCRRRGDWADARCPYPSNEQSAKSPEMLSGISGESAPFSDSAELLGREHQARGRTRSRPRLAALARARVDSGAVCSRARSRHVLLGGALVPLPVMPSSFWFASTKPEAALARGQGWQPWQERGWP